MQTNRVSSSFQLASYDPKELDKSLIVSSILICIDFWVCSMSRYKLFSRIANLCVIVYNEAVSTFTRMSELKHIVYNYTVYVF